MTGDPHGSAEQLDETFAPTAAACAQVRQRVRTLLSLWRVKEDACEDVLLVVHELVANVVDHARTPFRIVVRMTGAAVKICVWDHNPVIPQLQPVDMRASRGRGMRLVAALSQQWGCDEEVDGKSVWALIVV